MYNGSRWRGHQRGVIAEAGALVRFGPLPLSDQGGSSGVNGVGLLIYPKETFATYLGSNILGGCNPIIVFLNDPDCKRCRIHI